MKICAVSNVPYGYGSPQIRYLLRSLESTFNAQSILINPVYPSRPVQKDENTLNIYTKSTPFSIKGLLEYLNRSVNFVNEIRPDFLILVNPMSLFVLNKLKFEPHKILYYGLEPLDYSAVPVKSLSKFAKKINYVIYPELNRLKKDITFFSNARSFIVYNSNNLHNLILKGNKKRSFIYSGTLDPSLVDLEALEAIDKKSRLDVFGSQDEMKSNIPAINFKGVLSHEKLLEELACSKFSIVAWKPVSEPFFNACPNKFFESLALGVPVVTYPYPQVSELINRFGFGFLAKDFTTTSLIEAAQSALALNPSGYRILVQKAREAFEKHLSWDIQTSHLLTVLEREF